MSLVLRSLACFSALALMVAGGLAFLALAHGIADPAGLKMADDASPFGTPPSMASLVLGCAFSVLMAVFGAWTVRRLARKGGQAASSSGEELSFTV